MSNPFDWDSLPRFVENQEAVDVAKKYARLFGTDLGQEVLADLRRRFVDVRTCFPHAGQDGIYSTYFAGGMREAVREIEAIVKQGKEAAV